MTFWRLVASVLVLVTAVAGCGAASRERAVPVMPGEDTTLGAGDVFDVRVFGEADLSGTYRVAQDGTIDFPLVGRLAVASREPTEVADLIASRLRDGGMLRNPQVSVLVKEYNSKRISVVGAVARTGTFPMSAGLTVVQAISLAGGFTPLASRNQTVVTRRVGDRVFRYRVAVDDVTDGQVADFPLAAGDILYVPERVFLWKAPSTSSVTTGSATTSHKGRSCLTCSGSRPEAGR